METYLKIGGLTLAVLAFAIAFWPRRAKEGSMTLDAATNSLQGEFRKLLRRVKIEEQTRLIAWNDSRLEARFANAEYVVEVTEFERGVLQLMHGNSVSSWRNSKHDDHVTVGYLFDLPIVVRLSYARIGSVGVVFVEHTSRVVDYKLLEDWVRKYRGPDPERNGLMEAGDFARVLKEVTRRDAERKSAEIDKAEEETQPA